MASSIFSVPFGGSGSVGNVVGINTLTNAQHFVDVADSAMYTVVADEAARLALTTPYDRYVYQTDTAEVWYWDTVGSAWEKDTPVIKHFVDSGNAYHHLLLPEYSLLKTLGDTIHEYEIWEGITSGTGGTVTVPTHGTIVLDQYVGGSDCLITKVDATTGRPVDEPARDSGGAIVTGTLDIAGNYTLSAAPDAYPVAIVFQIQLAERYKTAELTPAQILNETELPTAERTTFDNTTTNTKATNVQDALESLDNDRTVSKEPTGFVDPENVIVSYDGTARTITLTGTVEAYYKGEQVTALTSGWVSDPHTDAVGEYFLLYNGTAFVWGTSPWDFSDLMIAFVYRDGVNVCLRECHGTMPWQAHKEFHEVIGTYLKTGGDISGYVLNSTTAADRRPDIAEALVYDEDLPTTLPSLTSNLYSWLYLSSTDTANITNDNAEILSVTGAVPNYNLFTGGVWTQSAFPVNAYGKVFVMAIPVTADVTCQKNRFIFIQPQFVSTNLSAVQARTPNNVTLGQISTALAEYVFIGEIIVRYTAADWQVVEVNKLTGTRYSQVSSPTGSFLTTVAHDDSLTGNGTAASPLGLSGTFTPLADSTTAFQFFKADGTTPVLQIDTTNELIRCKTYMSGSDDVLRLKNDASTATLSIYDDGTADLTATDNILVYDTVSNFNWLELDRVVGMTVSKSGAQSILGANYLQLNSGTFVTEMESGLISYDGTEVLGFTDTALTIYPSVIKPDADATTAIQITKADGTTSVLSVDTTNGAINLDTNPSTAALTERKVFTATMSNTPDSTIHSAMVKFQVPDDGVEPVAIFTSEQDDNDINTFGYFAAQAGNFRIGIAKKSENIPLLTPAIFGSASLVEITPNTKFSGNITANGTAVFSKDVRAANNLIVGDNPGTTSKRQLLLYENSATAQLIQFCNSATGFASSSDGFVTGITSAGVGYIWHYDNLGISFGTNNTSAGQITASGYWQIGSGAPSIKMKKLTGTTASTEGGTVTVSHGLTGDKIISVTGIVRNDTNEGVVNGVVSAGYQFDISYNSSAIAISNHSTNSEEILSKPFVVTIFYEA